MVVQGKVPYASIGMHTGDLGTNMGSVMWQQVRKMKARSFENLYKHFGTILPGRQINSGSTTKYSLLGEQVLTFIFIFFLSFYYEKKRQGNGHVEYLLCVQNITCAQQLPNSPALEATLECSTNVT